MSHTACQCQMCVSWDQQEDTCRELKSPCYGGAVSPFRLACSQYLSRHTVFAPKNTKRKKWHKVKTMDDLEQLGARLC